MLNRLELNLSLKNDMPLQEDNAFACSNLIEETGKTGNAAFQATLYRTAK